MARSPCVVEKPLFCLGIWQLLVLVRSPPTRMLPACSRPNPRLYFGAAAVVTHVCHVSNSLLRLYGVCYGCIRTKAAFKNIQHKLTVVLKYESGMKCFIVKRRRE